MKSQQGFSRFKVNNYNNNNEPVVQPPSDPNKVMRFDNKTDEEFVNSSKYKTHLPIEVLISNPEPKRKRKNKIPRRLNKWIIYRRDKSTKFKGLKAPVVTENIRKMWANEPEEVKDFFAALSRLAVKSHIKKYGEEYKYKPGPYKKSKRNQRKKRILSPSSEESSPNISELMDTTSSSSESSPELSFFPTPLLESMQFFPLPSDITSGSSPELPFFPTPESPATSSISDFEDSFTSMQAFPPLSDISFSEVDNSYKFSTNAGQLPLPSESEESLSAQPLTPAALNFTPQSCSAFEKLYSTFTEEQLQLLSRLELAQDNGVSIERDSSVRDLLEENSDDINCTLQHNLNDLYQIDFFKENSDTTKPQDDFLTSNSATYQDQTYNNNIQHNLMVYNDIQQRADSTNLMDYDYVFPDWLLFDIDSDVNDTNFDCIRQLSL